MRSRRFVVSMEAGQNYSNKGKNSEKEEPGVCQKILKKAGHFYWDHVVSENHSKKSSLQCVLARNRALKTFRY